jgi:hypothetical protein
MKELLFRFGAIFLLAAVIPGCGGMQTRNAPAVKPHGTAPVIVQSFASKKIRPGDTWKGYLIARDPDGDMKNIVAVIDQPGVGTYPVSLTKIQKENQKELSGYVFLNTTSPADLDFVDLSLTIQIQDQAGNMSQPAVFPLSINNQYRQEPPPPGVFQERDLGPILITLRSLRKKEDGGGIFPGRSPFRRR